MTVDHEPAGRGGRSWITEPAPVADHPAPTGDAVGDPDRLGPLRSCLTERVPADPPAPNPVLAMIHSAFLARTVATLVELGVVEELAGRPRSIAELGRILGVAAEPLQQLVRGTAAAGLVRSAGGTGLDEVFALTETGETLREGHPSATRDLVLMLQGADVLDCLRALPERVRRGETGPEVALGRSWFEHVRTEPELAARFDRMMVALHGGEHEAVAAAYDMDWAWNVVDVGGGLGGLTLALLAANDHLTGTVLDLPDVAARAQRTIVRAGYTHRCSTVAGDFFDGVPHGADAYVLASVLHAWSDADCVRILRSVADGLTPGARLLVVENVLPAGDAPHPGRALDLLMAALTHGHERTAEEFRLLLAAAGLRIRSVVPTASAVSVIEAERDPLLG
ncbi:methyltransferase [Pseudonocardia pini]|uniref:methyltransferase n=1 Tax=Pseudonocardia pini TaxID=2758030 RepID=UPI0015F040A9|nr:methyltransferase [Pseudonocardia pini]